MTAASSPPSASSPAQAIQPAVRLYGLPAIVSPATRFLVLGSFPGAQSLALQRYYAHPQNHFWKILSALWAVDLVALDYADRCRALLDHGLGLWDVYASCERAGSLDSAIRHARVNDFGALAAACPLLEAVAHNGAESHRHAPAVAAAWQQGTGRASCPAYRLPSTSPANASWGFARKLAAWGEVLGRHGVASPAAGLPCAAPSSIPHTDIPA